MKIELRNIHKRFGPVHANDDISATFSTGRIIGILGENGAGKSTLMKILSGFQPADSGEIWLDDRRVAFDGPEVAIANGIGMLQQDPLDIGAFTVLENFIYGTGSGFLPNKRQARRQLAEISQRFGFDLNPNSPASSLSIAQRQQLAVVRLLALNVQTLILDEPTTGISAEQKDILFGTLKDLAHAEGMSVLLVSHKLEDVISLCDEVIVLRAGQLVGQRTMPATKSDLVRMMFGQDVTTPERQQRNFSDAPVVLELDSLHARQGRIRLDGFSLQVRAGEVIGLAGLDGNGQGLIMRSATGLHRIEDGHVWVNGIDMTGKAYHQFMNQGVVFGAAGRLEEGLVAGLTLNEHIALVQERNLIINWERVHRQTTERITHYNVHGRPTDTIETLSGGNQQRVLMAMLPEQPLAMVLEEPTRGLDVDSARWIWEQLLDRCQRGASLIFSSADLDELVTYSDRIVVCFAGTTLLVDHPERMTHDSLGHLIGGAFDYADS